MLTWEKLQVGEPKHEFTYGSINRTKVPGGWLISVFWSPTHGGGPGICFYPDPTHEWDGGSVSEAEGLAERVMVH